MTLGKIIRTPDERFTDLPDFPFQPQYHELGDGLRLHYLDEGDRGAPIVLMMHGEPSWCYLYRHMIPPVVEAGYRVIAPDLIGFGRSDKPTRKAAFSYAGHVAWMREWMEALDLRDVLLACQDWGSLIGLRLVAAMPDRFASVVLSNGGLPEGGEPPKAFTAWRRFARWSPFFPIGGILQKATSRALTDAEVAAYDAPFPSRASKAAARMFPALVPFGDDVAVPDQKAAWSSLEAFDKPFTCAFSNRDPITRGGDKQFKARVPGAAKGAHRTLNGHHFIQEDDPHGFVDAILETAAIASLKPI
ncbi:haloalkane dehalogenase [Aurantiacibacter gangjinensis]|uniref:Haloalkane dehalogenase n=1 Tax=Aurantiacibacter gangjinensis TaxID=502682 RepID=A0A0G9MPE1_9SPHN|nr:haloalkane dehalogenase [Aurantiacibacter gangjinensis]APE28380.1 Hydrolase, alpha/beta fold family protein, group4 [Aurantiacibacter gangjinensis]KLE32607.1 haloalkane dehalogenase [Aurantiacibacter gangjinensis]